MATRQALDTTHAPSGTKLEAVLAEICARLGTITITKAVKLPYLVDVVAEQVLGHRITEGTFEAWDYGVVTREVWDLAKKDGGAYFRVGEHFYSEGGRTVALADGAEPPELAADEVAVVGYVVERFGHLNAGDLGDLTKSLNPDFAAEEWGSNRAPATGEEAFARLRACEGISARSEGVIRAPLARRDDAGIAGPMSRSRNAARGDSGAPAVGPEISSQAPSPSWLDLWRRLPDLDLDDASLWGEPIEDAEAFARETMRG